MFLYAFLCNFLKYSENGVSVMNIIIRERKSCLNILLIFSTDCYICVYRKSEQARGRVVPVSLRRL